MVFFSFVCSISIVLLVKNPDALLIHGVGLKIFTCVVIQSNKFLFDKETSSTGYRRQGKTGIFERRSTEDATLKQKQGVMNI